ncbi:DUF5018 domain-containing protein [uncultured Mesonia sp.]|uniref:DUF5018 domain-containing protein n=1 Tax=uncultured Mesonia sp. TaxID=399731 RepID=UPI00374E3D9B
MRIKATLIILFSLLLISCSKDDEPKLSSENKIISFKITENGEQFNGAIDHSSKIIRVTTSDLDLSNSITPIIEISNNASISPSFSTAQNFSQNVQYTVTAENGNEAIYTVMVNSSDNKITSFKITPDKTTFSGVINESNNTITIEAIGLESNSSLIPEIEFSQNATIFPSQTSEQDFSQNVQYTVTAQNGEQATYTVITNNTPLSDEKKILSFQFNIDGEIFDGIIDHSTKTIDIDTYKDPTNISPIISISDGATISPDSSELQNFMNDVQYTVTAANQSSNIYTVKTKWISFIGINSANNTSNIATKYYSNATPYVRTANVDLSLPNSKIILENTANSYELNFNNYNTNTGNDNLFSFFQIEFPANVVTANNYKLKYVVNGQVKSISNFDVDIVSDNVPVIISANQTSYSYNDTLILTGQNLLPGIRIAAHNVIIYHYNSSYVSINTDGTELTLPLNVNYNMFPSWVGQPSPYPTPIIIYYNGRYGETIVVDFI